MATRPQGHGAGSEQSFPPNEGQAKECCMPEAAGSSGQMGDAAVAGVFASPHPLVRDKLTALRRKETEPKLFRELIQEISWLLAYEALADARLEDVQIETPPTVTT